MATILLVDDEAASLAIMEEALRDAGHRPISVRNVKAALTVLERGGVELIVSDYRMPEITGLEFLEILREEEIEVGLIMATGYGSIDHAVESIKAGAADYITKPFRAERFVLTVEQTLEFQRLRKENAQLRQEVVEFRSGREIIGESEVLKRTLDTIRSVARSRASVLLEGESGTGKELLARAVHNLSDRSEGPFVAINCAALPESLVESILFGHEKGAFTGAVKRVSGAFERANQGTLLLDEISEMREDLQAKLLRVLQEQEFERVGGSAPVRTDVRVVATTNRDLASEVEEGRFREDLYFRLSVVPIRVPPLRERPEDIPKLATYFAHKAADQLGKTFRGISEEALRHLQELDWPGNVRQLSHAVERAVILTPGGILDLSAFDFARFGLKVPEGSATGKASGPDQDLVGSSAVPAVSDGMGPEEQDDEDHTVLETFDLSEAEEILIQRALEHTEGNRTHAAQLLGINVRTLRNKLNRPD